MNDEILIPAGGVVLPGDLEVPDGARAIIVFAHGSGSSRLSTRNRFVASVLHGSGRFGTLLFDLLTPHEDVVYANRFDIGLLANRLEAGPGAPQAHKSERATPTTAANVAASPRSDPCAARRHATCA